MGEGITGFQTINLTNLTDIGLGDLLGELPPEILGGIESLMLILRTLGIIAIIYFILIRIGAILNIRRSLKIKKIYKKVYEIDNKVDRILEQRKEEHKVLKIDNKEHKKHKKHKHEKKSKK